MWLPSTLIMYDHVTAVYHVPQVRRQLGRDKVLKLCERHQNLLRARTQRSNIGQIRPYNLVKCCWSFSDYTCGQILVKHWGICAGQCWNGMTWYEGHLTSPCEWETWVTCLPRITGCECCWVIHSRPWRVYKCVHALFQCTHMEGDTFNITTSHMHSHIYACTHFHPTNWFFTFKSKILLRVQAHTNTCQRIISSVCILTMRTSAYTRAHTHKYIRIFCYLQAKHSHLLSLVQQPHIAIRTAHKRQTTSSDTSNNIIRSAHKPQTTLLKLHKNVQNANLNNVQAFMCSVTKQRSQNRGHDTHMHMH